MKSAGAHPLSEAPGPEGCGRSVRPATKIGPLTSAEPENCATTKSVSSTYVASLPASVRWNVAGPFLVHDGKLNGSSVTR